MQAGGSSSDARKEVVGRLGSREFWFLTILFLGYFAFTADRTVLSSMLKPMSSSLSAGGTVVLGVSGTAWLASAQFIGILSFVLISGAASDAGGHRKVIAAGVGVFTAFTWMIGLSQTLAEAFVFRLFSGFGEGLFWPAAMSAIADRFGRSKGLALGIFYAGFDLGGAFGNGVGSATFALTSDWRTAFFIAPLVGLPVLAGLAISREAFSPSSGPPRPYTPGRDYVEVLRRGRNPMIFAFAFFATWASIWQIAYLPYYYSTVLGASVPVAGVIGAAVLISGMAGKVLIGRVSDRVRRDRLLLGLSSSVVIVYLVFFSGQGFEVGVATALVLGFFSAAVFPVMQALAADSSYGRSGTALGLTTTFQSAAAVVGTLFPGLLFSLGVGRAIALDAMVPAVATAVIALFLREGPRQKAESNGPLPESNRL